MPDCGDNSCIYATERGGMRTNGGCRCDDCPACGKAVRPLPRTTAEAFWSRHYDSCTDKDWVPPHHRKEETGKQEG